jgi:hypothetical protein
MAVTVKRKNREIRDGGVISFEVTGADVGKSLDFMGIAEGFRVTDVNVTVDEAFANVDNKISVGIEGDLVRFMAQQQADSVAGFAGNNRQLTATQSMAIVVDVVGTASPDDGKATVTVGYAKLPVSKQEY